MKLEAGENWLFNFMGFSALGSDLRKAGWKIEFLYFYPARMECSFDVCEVYLRHPGGAVFADFDPDGGLCNANMIDISDLNVAHIEYRHIPAVLKRIIELQDHELRRKSFKRRPPASIAHQMLKLVA